MLVPLVAVTADAGDTALFPRMNDAATSASSARYFALAVMFWTKALMLTPRIIHARKKRDSFGILSAMPAGERKIPLPIVDPTRTATALKRPSFLGRVLI